MAISFTGTKNAQSEVQEITQELYRDSLTFQGQTIEVNDGHKSGADVYESKVGVTAKAASSAAVTATGDISLEVNKTPVTLSRIQFSDIVDETVLLDTRFERSMASGAFNLVSDEFDNAVLQFVQPAIGESLENMVWNGATTAQKAAIAGLTPGAAQGSISASAQTLVAAMPTNLFNSVPATILYNTSQAKGTPGAGLGDYKKVLSPAGSVTSANIAEEYAKIYETADEKVINSRAIAPTIFAPLADRQLMKIANNSVGAASNQNFLFEGTGTSERAFYNGVEVKFVPLVGFRILTLPPYLKLLMDLASDANVLEIGQVANGAQQRYIKSIQAIATWVVNQRFITLYNG